MAKSYFNPFSEWGSIKKPLSVLFFCNDFIDSKVFSMLGEKQLFYAFKTTWPFIFFKE